MSLFRSQSRSNVKKTVLGVEALEGRLTPATAIVSTGTLVVTSSNAGEHLAVTLEHQAEGLMFVVRQSGHQIAAHRQSAVWRGDLQMWGNGGDDVLCNYTLLATSAWGGEGNDYLYGSFGVDKLTGGEGNDVLDGGFGEDQLFGDGGNDVLYGGWDFSNNKLDGEEGNDVLYGGLGRDEMYGAGGNDFLFGSMGNDYLYGGHGNDYLYGEFGDDMLAGWTGDDHLSGGFGIDYLYGEDGDDYLYGGVDGVRDYLYGGAGHDNNFFWPWRKTEPVDPLDYFE